MPVCDGCGARTDDAHIARRNERVDFAKRFRPALVRVLFLDAAPPARIEDFFYNPAKDRGVRSIASKMYFDEITKCLGTRPGTEPDESATLAEFQRRGFFVTYALECAFEDQSDPQGALRRAAPSAIKRVQENLRPSYVVPISQPTQDLIRLFGLIGWGERLILSNGGPFVDPFLGNPKRQMEMNTGFGAKIKQALSVLP